MKQPTALRLADALWALMSTVSSKGALEAAVAELRRLALVEQRAAELLAALDAKFPTPARHDNVAPQMFNLRAAIAKVEENT